MVGYEPDFDDPTDWDKELDYLLETDIEKKKIAALSVSFITPCNTREDEDNASLTRPVVGPYHLRKNANDDYNGRLATPLIQVFYVSLSTNLDDGEPCQVYGSIQVFEGPNHRFDLYNRDPEDSETIDKQGTLSLIGPHGDAILPSLDTTLNFCLKDRIRGVEVVKGNLHFDPVADDSYDRLLKHDVPGAHGVAHVYYVVFQFAVYGVVQVTVPRNNNDEKNCNATDIYGSIVARYENGTSYCSTDQEMKLFETQLFNKQQHQSLCVLAGTPIKLSRNVVAVPVYSSLTIEVNLWDSNGKMAGECLKFPAFGGNPLRIQTKNARVEVEVWWHHAYFYLYQDRFLKEFNRGESSNGQEEMQKKPMVPHDQHPSSSFVPRSIPQAKIRIGVVRVEVFTVFVGGITEKITALCGAILVDDGSDKFSIYNRDNNCCELLQDNSLASIDVNYRAIDNCYFDIALYLRDPVRKIEVSRGSLGWNDGSLESYMSWYDKRLCSVVRGDNGYAAVHYQVFSNSYEAFVEVKLFSDGPSDAPFNLYGTLFGRYGGYDYTSYDKKYYTSRLFDRPRDRSTELKAGSKISMQKSIVVVPAKSSLIIEADLMAFGSDNVNGAICGLAEFKINKRRRVSKIIRGEHYWIKVYASFEEES